MQMYMTLDALADGGVYAGVPKEQALNLVAHTMMVSKDLQEISFSRYINIFYHLFIGISKNGFGKWPTSSIGK
jgi:hypothetical protein